jgi:hypothetical protein
MRILRGTEIFYRHEFKDGVTPPVMMRAEVPSEGEPWLKQRDSPNTAEVRAGTLSYIVAHHPDLLKPAFNYILEEFGVDHKHTVAYTSNNIPVEFFWGDIKGYAGSAETQVMGRTAAQCIEVLRRKAFFPVVLAGVPKPPIPCMTWFLHVADNWSAWIKQDNSTGGPLSGTIDNLVGVPAEGSQEWLQWLLWAGDNELPEVGDDVELDGEVDIVEDAEELLRAALPTENSDI